jgi:hypothetical protein
VQVRRSETDPLLHEWSTADSNASCTGTEVVLNVVAATTDAWTWTDAYLQVVATDTGGKPHIIAQGPIHAEPRITQ